MSESKPGERVVWRVYWGTGGAPHTSLSMASHSATKEEALTLMRSSVAASRLVRVRIRTVPRLHDFSWALKQMRAGRRVMRKAWNYHWAAPDDFLTPKASAWTAPELVEFIQAEDWQLAPTEAP